MTYLRTAKYKGFTVVVANWTTFSPF